MLRVVLAEESRDRPIKQFFELPLIEAKLKHKFHLLENRAPKPKTGDVVLAMGGKVLEWYRAQGMLPKNLSVNKLRNQVHHLRYHQKRDEAGEPIEGTGTVVPTIFSFDPTISLLDATKGPDISWDIRYTLRYIKTGSDKPVLGTYEWADGFSEVIKKIKRQFKKTGKAVPCSLDLETIGLDEFAPEGRVVTIQFSYKEGHSLVYVVPESGILPPHIHKQVKWLCTTDKIKTTGANLKFDARWIKQHFGFWITNQTFDTGLVGALLDENRSNSLNLHAKIYTDLGGYDDEFERNHDKSRMDLALKADPKGFLTYAGGDTDACLRATTPLRKRLLKDKALTNFYTRLLQPATEAFAVMEHRGVVLDVEQYKNIESEVQTYLDEKEKAIFDLMPARLKMAHRAAGLKLSRPALIQEYMFGKRGWGLGLKPKILTESKEEPATHMEHLEMFQHVPEAAAFIGLLKEYRSASKTMSTYVQGFQKHIRSDDRFHPSYRMFKGDYGDNKDEGTDTGRTSATDPAYQTIPKHTIWAKLLRTVFVPPPGMAILKVDYSQGELRVTACVAGETTMIQTYQQGIDLHLRTGALLNGIPFGKALKLKKKNDPRIKSIRQGGKAGNFGLIYGMQAPGFQQYAMNSYGVEMPLSQAEAFRNDFFEEYPMLEVWHKRSIATARRYGMIRSPLGRLRHLPQIHSKDQGLRSKAERQSINSPIQCTLSDLALLATSELYRMYPDLWMFGMTHDELAFYVPEDQVMEWARKIIDVMENLPLKELFGWEPELEFTAEAEASTVNMALCEELELAA